MTDDEVNLKKREYIERNRFWTDKAITQLGFSINLFTTFGIGFLAFLKPTTDIQIVSEIVNSCNVGTNSIFKILPTILITISISLGFISILSRLYDLRITRHLSLIRKRFFSDKKGKGLIKTNFETNNNPNYCFIFIKTMFCKIDLIKNEDYNTDTSNSEKLKAKFHLLQEQATILGDITWKSHKLQILFFIISIFSYIIEISCI